MAVTIGYGYGHCRGRGLGNCLGHGQGLGQPFLLKLKNFSEWASLYLDTLENLSRPQESVLKHSEVHISSIL